jgi:hypothetical protein
VVDVLLGALDDYTIDSRGDIGSLARLKAIDATVIGWEAGAFQQAESDASTDIEHQLLSRLVRLSAEKLDKVRAKAWHALQLIWPRDRYITTIDR